MTGVTPPSVAPQKSTTTQEVDANQQTNNSGFGDFRTAQRMGKTGGPKIESTPYNGPKIEASIDPNKSYFMQGEREERSYNRPPDYYSLNINVLIPNPLTLTLVGVTFQMTVDSKGNFYAGPGVTAGKSFTGVSGSLTAGYILQGDKPDDKKLNDFCTGNSFNGGAGIWLGAGITAVPGQGKAAELGAVSPQAGVSWHYTRKFGNIVDWLKKVF